MKLTPTVIANLAARWAVRLARRPFRAHGFILMYHSITDMVEDPWNIAVSPANFAGHMDVLSDMADVVPLTDLRRSLRRGRRTRPVAAVTFDDGYLNNLTAARPVLDALDLPATVFVPTGWIGDPRPMWWERLSHAVFATPRLPAALDLHYPHRSFSWDAPDLNEPGTAGRRARFLLHRAIWDGLRELPHDDARQAVIDLLVQRLGTDETSVAPLRTMNATEVRCIADGGRIQIGSHSVTHPTLPGQTRVQKAWEIERSAEACAELLGQRPAAFAYPYGDLDAECVDLVRQSGYEVACSTRENIVWHDDDPLLLPRIAVGNWSPAEFRTRLGWYWLA